MEIFFPVSERKKKTKPKLDKNEGKCNLRNPHLSWRPKKTSFIFIHHHQLDCQGQGRMEGVFSFFWEI